MSSFVVAVVVVVVVATKDSAALVITVGAIGVAITFGVAIDVVGEITMTLCSCNQFIFRFFHFLFSVINEQLNSFVFTVFVLAVDG